MINDDFHAAALAGLIVVAAAAMTTSTQQPQSSEAALGKDIEHKFALVLQATRNHLQPRGEQIMIRYRYGN